MKTKNMAEFLSELAKEHLGTDYVYCNQPYSCMLSEAITSFRHYEAPNNKQVSINKTENRVDIEIKPLKGSRKRKPYKITLWNC